VWSQTGPHLGRPRQAAEAHYCSVGRYPPVTLSTNVWAAGLFHGGEIPPEIGEISGTVDDLLTAAVDELKSDVVKGGFEQVARVGVVQHQPQRKPEQPRACSARQVVNLDASLHRIELGGKCCQT